MDAPLASRMFLIGPNASGKSNLLDAFRFLRDVAGPGGGFQKAIDDRGGVSSLRCLAARRYPDIRVEVEIGDGSPAGAPPLWHYCLEFNQDKQRRASIKKEQVRRLGQCILNRPDENDRKDDARLTQTHLEQVNVNKDFREVARFFATVDYLHIVPQLIRDPDRPVGRSDDPFGADFLERLSAATERTRRSRLGRIEQGLKVAVPQLKELRLQKDHRGVPHLRALYDHWRPQGAYQDETLFSDGTLRLIGLLWALLDGQGPLLLEEPELSLHPGIVRRIPRIIHRLQRSGRGGDRQVLMSTHSSDLVCDRGIGADEVLMLRPSGEGTTVVAGKNDAQVRALLEAGASVAEAVLPATEPENARQLEIQW